MSSNISPPVVAPDNMLVRQQPLSLTLPKTVYIVGCGGVGSWIAVFLALAGVRNLVLFDPDEIDETNLNRLPLGVRYVGANKALALSNHIMGDLVPACNVTAYPVKWDIERLPAFTMAPDWIVAGTDTWRSRRLIYQWALDNKIRYIEASAEGEIGGATGEPATFITPEEEHPGYASVPVWVGPCVTSAYLVCAHILHNLSPGETSYRLGWLNGVPTLQSLG